MQDNIQKENLLQVGSMLSNGKYRIDSYLSSGGFGNTYVATDTAFDERVAIKELFIKGVCGRHPGDTEISISLTENQRAFVLQQEKFRKEARRLRKLSNDHIVSVHDLFDENGTSYYVMDYIDGENLSKRVKSTHRPMAEAELLLILPQVLDALESVHSEGIWHLDLKPANIMLDSRGNVILIDFGASKQLRNASGDSLSTSSAMTYTPGYAASEQMEQNLEKFGPWTDLYSLGASLYYLLTLQQPPSPSDIDEDPQEALKMPDGISKKTRDLILWLMKPNRKMRPQSVADVKQFLLEANDATPKLPQEPEHRDDEEADTVLKNGGAATPGTETDGADSLGTTDGPGIGRLIKMAVAAVVLCLLAFGAFYFFDRGTSEGDVRAAADTVATKVVSDMQITVSEGPANMHQYAFTGEIVDTIGALPNGKGVARYPKHGSIPAATYKGNFVNGVCDDASGEATLTFTTGDKFVGTFSRGFYGQGKYIAPDGSYFEGTFRKGKPYNGKWYTANGTPEDSVINGV